MSFLSRLLGTAPDPREEVRPLWHRVIELARDPAYYTVQFMKSMKIDRVAARLLLGTMTDTDPAALAAGYLCEAVPDVKSALEGARDIVAEGLAEDAALLGRLRAHMKQVARLSAKVVAGKETEGAKFRDWFDFAEPIATMPSHRALALLRGRNEGVLRLSLDVDRPDPESVPPPPHPCEGRIAVRFGIRNQGRPADRWLAETARWAWSVGRERYCII